MQRAGRLRAARGHDREAAGALTAAATNIPLTVAEGIRAAARRTPAKVALADGERELTYGAMVDRIERVTGMAGGELGLARGEHAAILAPNCLEYAELLTGLAAAGTPAALVSAHATPAEVGRVCEDAGARVLFVHPSLQEAAYAAESGALERVVVIGDEYERLLGRARRAGPDPAGDEWDVLCIPYTSGTTGEPKGLLLSQRSRVLTFFAMAVDYGSFGPDVRSLCAAPLYHGAGFVSAFAPLVFGGFCSLLSKFDPELVLARIEERRITAVNLVPTHFTAILGLDDAVLDRYDTSSLTALMSNAAALSGAAKERIVERFGDGILYEGYGSTEAGFVTTLKPRDQLRKQQSVGREFPFVEVRLLDEAGEDVPDAEVGELYARSPYMFSGYWSRPELTASAFHGGWFTAGDLARRDDEGYVYLVDRKGDRIISGGINVYPREVEEELLRHPAVADAAVVGVPDPYWGEAVHAAVTLHPGARAGAEELGAFCAERLMGPKRPKAFVVVPSLPRNSMGKVLRRELRDTLAAAAERTSPDPSR